MLEHLKIAETLWIFCFKILKTYIKNTLCLGHSVLNLADRAEYFYLYVFVHIWGVELKKPQYIVVQLLNVFCILWFGCVEIWVRVPVAFKKYLRKCACIFILKKRGLYALAFLILH